MKFGVLRTLLLLLGGSGALFAVPVFDLQNDWNGPNNPNGTWSFLQGSTLLPYQTNICCLTVATSGYAPGVVPGNFVPAWVQAVGAETNYYNRGDILVHSTDSANGTVSEGEATLLWTSPLSGIFNIDFSIWYASNGLNRSNEFTLSLRGAPIASGTVSETSFFDRLNAFTFSTAGLFLNEGDQVSLVVAKSEGQQYGSFAGVGLTLTDPPVSLQSVPEPNTQSLFLLALVAISGAGVMRRKAQVLKPIPLKRCGASGTLQA